MATITTRAGKAAPLTNAEVDANFTGLNADVATRLVASSNLLDLPSPANARTNLGLDVVENKTSATIRSEITSDNVTTALGFTPPNQASAALTGTPTAPTAAVNTSTTQLATTAFVNAEIANDAAPLSHVGAGGTQHTAATVSVAGFMSAADKAKLDGVAAGATTNTGTVTSVSGIGAVSGLTLSGSVTAAGSLTLGGALALTSGHVTNGLGFTPYNATNPAGYINSSASITGNAATATNAAALTTGRTIALTGDVSYTSPSFNGSANVTATATLANTGVVAGTYTKITVDAKGRATSGTTLSAADVPTLNQNTTGTAANVTGVVALANGGTASTSAAAALVALGVQTSATGSKIISAGTTAQRDVAPSAGFFRFNTTLSKFEGYTGNAWGAVGGGATGGGADEIFIENGQTVSANYTIPAGRNAMSTGPITVNSGVTVTISDGSRYVVL